MKKCIIYSRVASSEQSNPRAFIEIQNVECKDFAQSQGYTVSNIFEDINVSGIVGILNRIDEIIEYAKANKVRILITEDSTRLSRSAENLSLILKKLNEIGIKILFVRDADNLALSFNLRSQQAQSQNPNL